MAPPVKDVSVAEFAELLGVTAQRVYQHIQEGMPHRRRGRATRNTRVVPREAIGWLVERAKRLAEEQAAKGRNSDLDRIRKAEADLKELELHRELAELVPAAELRTYADAFVGTFAATAAGRLQRFEREIVRASTPGQARRLTQQIHAALMAGAQEYADAVEAEAEQLEAGDEPDAAAGEDAA